MWSILLGLGGTSQLFPFPWRRVLPKPTNGAAQWAQHQGESHTRAKASLSALCRGSSLLLVLTTTLSRATARPRSNHPKPPAPRPPRASPAWRRRWAAGAGPEGAGGRRWRRGWGRCGPCASCRSAPTAAARDRARRELRREPG